MNAAPSPRIARRVAFAIAAYAFAATMLGTTLPTPLYVFYQAEFGFSTLMITVIFATYAVGVIAALLLFGRLSDEVGRRRVLLAGLALSALSAVAFLLAQGLAPLLVGRLLSGLSAGIFTGTATATLVDLADPKDRTRATLVATIANMGGLGCGPLLAGAIAEWTSSPLHLPFWVDLALLVPAVVGVWLITEPTPPKPHPQLRPQGLRVPAEIRAVFLRASMAAFAGFAVLGLFTAVGPAFAGQVLGVTNHAAIGLIVFSVFAASALGQLALGSLVPAGRALPFGCSALVVGMVALGAGLADASLPLLLLGGMVAGFGQGLSFRAGLGAVNAAAPEAQRGEVASSFFVVAYVAISIPVVGEGLLAQAIGLRDAGLVFVAAVAAISALVLVLLAQERATATG
ncbi:MAG TPA: MFS transporter [Solirubrobacterales bacterium]|nr:MFS transporter [Solirubrobacterales bacterium]